MTAQPPRRRAKRVQKARSKWEAMDADARYGMAWKARAFDALSRSLLPRPECTRGNADERARRQMRQVFAEAIGHLVGQQSRSLMFAHAGARIPDDWCPHAMNYEHEVVLQHVLAVLRVLGADVSGMTEWMNSAERAELAKTQQRVRELESENGRLTRAAAPAVLPRAGRRRKARR